MPWRGIWWTNSTAASTFVVSAVRAVGNCTAADRIHAMRKSVVGGIAATVANSKRRFSWRHIHSSVKRPSLRPQIQRVGWDLVAPTNPTRTYMRRPRPDAGHAAIFGDPTKATAESGEAFIAAAVDALAETFKVSGCSQERR